MTQKNSQHIKLKDFEILKDLGFGSYGKVQLVKRKEDQKLYAMKSMQMSNSKQKQKESALNQIRLLASINIPNVIGYKGSFYNLESQSICIIMEYADGGDLEHKINQRSSISGCLGFEENYVWKCAYEILKGLKILHENKIVHRDLKCANIFFGGGMAKIGDLNISKLTQNGFCSTQTGTPYYTSPEIWKGQKYDCKCDIWSLGCIIYEMCTLLPPFRAGDFPGLYQAVISGRYEEIPPRYSKQLRQFIKLSLDSNPKSRLGAAELLEKSFFKDYQLSLKEQLDQLKKEKEVSVQMVDAIECPKVLRFLNEKLPKSKFQQKGKKTVFFAAKDNDHQSANFKIKTKKIRSEKIINIQNDENQKTKKQVINDLKRPMSKKNIKLPPLEKQESKIKSTNKIISKGEIRSTKHLPGESKKLFLIK